MTKRAFIWDLDGTLLDSYDAILAGLEETYATYQLPFDRASIKRLWGRCWLVWWALSSVAKGPATLCPPSLGIGS